MPRKKPAAPATTAPTEPEGIVSPPAADGPPHRRIADDLLSVLAALPVDDALARLAALWRDSDHGTARRAIRAAAIRLLRMAQPAAESEPAVAAPAPVLPDPLPAAPPPPKPAPAPRAGAVTSLALEDAARMLLAAQEEDPPPPPIPADAMAALLALDDDADDQASAKATVAASFRPLPPPPELDDRAAPIPPAAAAKPKARRAKAKPVDPARVAEFLSQDAPAPDIPAPVAVDLDAAFAALDSDAPMTTLKPALDLSAQFAAMERDGD